MNLSEFIYPSTRFMMFGNCPKELQMFRDKGCEGIAINAIQGDLLDDDYYGKITFVSGELHQDSHFQRFMSGKWVKPMTVRDIFDQWGSVRYEMIVIDVPMQTRLIWYSYQLQVHMPKYHVLREDGHNEAVIEKAGSLGYAASKIEGDWLLLARQ